MIIHLLSGQSWHFKENAKLSMYQWEQNSVISVVQILCGKLLCVLYEIRVRVKLWRGVKSIVLDSISIPHNWPNFLRVGAKKMELFNFLSDKMVVIAYENVIIGKQLLAFFCRIAFVLPWRNYVSLDGTYMQPTVVAKKKFFIYTVDTSCWTVAVVFTQNEDDLL